jgi:hypothetical protein
MKLRNEMKEELISHYFEQMVYGKEMYKWIR